MKRLIIMPYVSPAYGSLDSVGVALCSIGKFLKDEHEVMVVGSKPDGLDDIKDVRWVEMAEADRGATPHTDMVRRICLALQLSGYPDKFCLWHDDMIAVNDFAFEELDHPRAITDAILSAEDSDNYYLRDMHYTLEALRGEGITYMFNYTVHCPVVYDTSKFLELVDRFGLTSVPLDFEMLYFNEQCRDPELLKSDNNRWRLMMDDLHKPPLDKPIFIGLNNKFNNREYLDELRALTQ